MRAASVRTSLRSLPYTSDPVCPCWLPQHAAALTRASLHNTLFSIASPTDRSRHHPRLALLHRQTCPRSRPPRPLLRTMPPKRVEGLLRFPLHPLHPAPALQHIRTRSTSRRKSAPPAPGTVCALPCCPHRAPKSPHSGCSKVPLAPPRSLS